jgi:hypothetical protein
MVFILIFLYGKREFPLVFLCQFKREISPKPKKLKFFVLRKLCATEGLNRRVYIHIYTYIKNYSLFASHAAVQHTVLCISFIIMYHFSGFMFLLRKGYFKFLRNLDRHFVDGLYGSSYFSHIINKITDNTLHLWNLVTNSTRHFLL